jgi:all-trans-retinol 13,14-reductase
MAQSEAGRQPRLWDKRGKDGPWDTLVIGSGMGGMTCAAILASLGERVLVLEQHYVPGGFTHMFKRPGYSWDVGVHAVGEVTDHSLTGRLLAKLSGGALEWASLGPVYDEFHFPGDFRIDFPDSPRQFRDNLLAAFPAEGPAIDGYLDHVRDVAASMKAYYLARLAPSAVGPLAERVVARRARRWLQRNTEEVLRGLTDDDRLRTVLASQWGYYGSTPGRSSFAIQALVTKHFLHGGYYPVGGASRIAETLLKTVADAGGWTRIRCDVERILVEGGRAVGVRLVDGEELRAKRIVSAAGVQSTVSRLLPPSLREGRWGRGVTGLRPAPAHVCLYIGFKGDIRAAGASGANKWFYDTWSRQAAGWHVDPAADAQPEAPILYCSFPSLKDPQHDPGPEQRHTGEVVTFVPWETFDAWRGSDWHKRGEAYDAFKASMTERLRAQLLARMPALGPLIDVMELSTPLTTDHFTRPMAGSIYGIEPTPARFANAHLRPRSPVKDLFFAGSEVVSVGVIGAMMGGALAAAAARPTGTLKLLRSLGHQGV